MVLSQTANHVITPKDNTLAKLDVTQSNMANQPVLTADNSLHANRYYFIFDRDDRMIFQINLNSTPDKT